MVTLNFTLAPEASSRLHDTLSCLAKFSDTVSIEARKDALTLSALNSSKSAYSSFILERKYFSVFEFASDNGHGNGHFTCSILNKALISVFKSRILDSRGRDTAIEKCEVSVQDQAEEAPCRFIIRMFCSHGVTKTHKLTYEAVEVMHALFDQNTANNRWSIRSTFLKEFTDYFGQKAEQLDIYSDDGKVTFLSFTDKVVNRKNEVLKQPLKTAVSVNTADFEHFKAQEKMHIIISVKDFRSIVAHADTLNTVLAAYYSTPGRPLQFSYSRDGLHCQCTLMTVGDYSGTNDPPAAPSTAPTRTTSRAHSTTGPATESGRFNTTEMAPSTRASARKSVRRLGHNESNESENMSRGPDDESESLFVPAPEEEDRRWDPTDYENDEETLGWDVSANNDAGFHPTFRDSASATASRSYMTGSTEEGLPPTQRVSQIQGLW